MGNGVAAAPPGSVFVLSQINNCNGPLPGGGGSRFSQRSRVAGFSFEEAEGRDAGYVKYAKTPDRRCECSNNLSRLTGKYATGSALDFLEVDMRVLFVAPVRVNA